MFVPLIVGAAISAYGAYKSSEAQKDQASAQEDALYGQAQITQWNAATRRLEGEEAVKQGNYEAGETYKQYSDTIAKQITGFSANNVVGGSTLQVEAYQAHEREMASLMQKYKGELKAWQANTGADVLDETASQQMKAADNAAALGKLMSNATLLGGLGRLVSSSAGIYESIDNYFSNKAPAGSSYTPAHEASNSWTWGN